MSQTDPHALPGIAAKLRGMVIDMSHAAGTPHLGSSLSCVDIVTAAEAGLIATPDDVILAWAVEHERVVLTYDKATMPTFAYERMERGEAMTGMIVLNGFMGIGKAIEYLCDLAMTSEPERLLNYIE